LKAAGDRDDREAWASYARSYDRVLPLLPFYREVVRRHVAAMSKPEIRAVLDVGAGTGNVSVPLADGDCRVTAIDSSPEMLRHLRQKMVGNNASKISIVERDAQDLSPWADACFDGATILLALFAMSHPRRALSEVVRVLRPGGLLVATETRKTFQLDPLLTFVDGFLTQNGLDLEFAQDWRVVKEANRVLDPGHRDSRLTVEEMEQSLLQAGFTIERLEDSHLGQCATLWAKKG
jgi:ubiquinone/menaquinone biosynthesis C-methylase UbiE